MRFPRILTERSNSYKKQYRVVIQYEVTYPTMMVCYMLLSGDYGG
jgi:hypothetical protein